MWTDPVVLKSLILAVPPFPPLSITIGRVIVLSPLRKVTSNKPGLDVPSFRHRSMFRRSHVRLPAESEDLRLADVRCCCYRTIRGDYDIVRKSCAYSTISRCHEITAGKR